MKIQPSDVRSVRPGFGLPPKFMSQLIGRTLTRDVTAATPVLPCDLNSDDEAFQHTFNP
jgi:N-acetylneuraminate synthase